MSNLPPNPYGTGAPQMNANPAFNHSLLGQVPPGQLPPGFAPKQDLNSNSPLPTSVSNIGQNNFNQSASSSPAFNHPGMLPPPHTGLPPMRPLKPGDPSINQNRLPPNAPISSASPMHPSPTPYPPNYPQINDNAPPLLPSSHQPLVNGPPGPPNQAPQFPVSTSQAPMSRPPVSSGFVPPISSGFGPPPLGMSTGQRPLGPAPITSQPNMTYGPPMPGPMRNSPLPGPSAPGSSGLPVSGPSTSLPPYSLPMGGPPVSGQSIRPPMTGPPLGPPVSAPPVGPPLSGPPLGPPISGPLSRPTMTGQPMGPSRPPNVNGPQSLSGPPGPLGPPMGQPSGSGPASMGPPGSQYRSLQNNGPPGPMSPPRPLGGVMSPPNMPSGPQSPPAGPQSLPPMSQPNASGLPSGPAGALPKSNMQGRYPQMPQSSYNHQQQPNQYPPQYTTQQLTNQMGQLSVTKQGFDQLWGHQMVDLLTSRQILPEYPENPPEIKLGHQYNEFSNCSPEIFRCTINRIPETNSLLQKSRLPLGILIHPFKDLNHLPVIQCSTIVRCRACRTYINPFVYFVDAKRWKCNLCYRVNDLPEEFQYDPVSKSYGDPSRRPEIKSATIEFIAPGEYMLRPPQPAVYLFLLDVSQIARDSGYLKVLCETLKNNLDQLPGDARTQVGFICYDAHVHYYLMSDGLILPKEMTVIDIDDVFLPSPESLLVNLGERRDLVKELLNVLPKRFSGPGVPASALGAALQAAYKLMAPTGGRITVFQTCLPNVGPGALQPREDPNARSSSEVAHLNPATDFYKRLALDCSGAQIAVDLFLLNSQYADLATLSGMSKFSAGTVYHIPLYKSTRTWQAEQFTRMLTRYLTRKIGFEAVMRVRCTRGITIHTFHGNFFVRSTDLLSLPNVSPDAGFGMQLAIEESLADLQQVCFQAALLYTSSKGERRIRVHTLALPTASNLTDVLHSADQQCIIGLVSKMAVDRCASASMSEAREALINVAVDALSAHKLAQNLPAGSASTALHAPSSLRLLPLYLLALLKRKAFRTGTSTRLDDRVADMCDMKTLPLPQLLRAVYPDLYPIHILREITPRTDDDDETQTPEPPRLHLSAERINLNGAYLLDDGDTMLIYVCNSVSPAFLSDTFGVAAFSQLPDEARSLPKLQTEGNILLHAFIDKLNDDRPYASNILVLRDNSPVRQLFTDRLVDDRVESAFAYYEFLQNIKQQVK